MSKLGDERLDSGTYYIRINNKKKKYLCELKEVEGPGIFRQTLKTTFKWEEDSVIAIQFITLHDAKSEVKVGSRFLPRKYMMGRGDSMTITWNLSMDTGSNCIDA